MTDSFRNGELRAAFRGHFGGECEDVFSSPGRVEIVGNHTDHNGGRVLTGAIDCDTRAAVGRAEKITLYSKGYSGIVIELDSLDKRADERGTSAALVRGVLAGFVKEGLNIGGFNAAADSTVFIGAGVSSSASFELLIAEILNVYYNGGRIDRLTLARIAQFAENVYFGKPCGMLDQSGIAMGGVSYIDFAGAAKAEKLHFPEGYDIVLINTGGDHSDLTNEYAAVREEMHAVAAAFSKERLRDVDECAFYREYPRLAREISGRAVLRAAHFFSENARVDLAAESLRQGNAAAFLDCVRLSGESSYTLLQNCYVAGDKKQPIPAALHYAKRLIKDGAVRVHGGGFLGTVLCVVSSRECAEFAEALRLAYGAENVFTAKIREEGACRLTD